MDGRECGGCLIVIEKNVECDEEVLEVGVLDGLREVACSPPGRESPPSA